MKVTFISDTHWIVKDKHTRDDLTSMLPGGPILVHAGDVSGRGTAGEIREFLEWFSKLPYTHKILIAGNHDFLFETLPNVAAEILAEYPGIHYLNDSGVIIEGLKFWGSPITPWFHNWAFNRFANEIGEHWNQIPADTDVLITHGPPHGILDETARDGLHVGCPVLLEKVKEIKPKVHVFGHIHEARGVHEEDGITFINAATVDLRYELYYQNPIEIDL